MDTEAAEFLSSGYLSPKQHEILRNRVHALLAEIRPQAVSLVDAFGIPDFQMNSALGRYDGNVYPNMIKFAQAEPLNGLKFNIDVNDPECIAGVDGQAEPKSKL